MARVGELGKSRRFFEYLRADVIVLTKYLPFTDDATTTDAPSVVNSLQTNHTFYVSTSYFLVSFANAVCLMGFASGVFPFLFTDVFLLFYSYGSIYSSLRTFTR